MSFIFNNLFNEAGLSPREYWLEKRKLERYKKRRALEKNLFVVPHLMTLTNAFCGFYSLILITQQQFDYAAVIILIGACFDALDGKIARYVGSAGPFGVQLDSLGDAISFCVAPIFLCYFWQLHRVGSLGILSAAIFLLSGLIRLARFNIMEEKSIPYFLGVPTTVAGGFLVVLFLNRSLFEGYPYFLLVLTGLILLLSFLMVSSIKFPAFKKMPPKKRVFYFVMIIGSACSIAGIALSKVLLVLFVLYFIGAFFITNLQRN